MISDVVTIANREIAGRLKMCGQRQMDCYFKMDTEDPADLVVLV